ncbi:hypothetical protein [Paenibacillus sp. FSL W8-1287]|uniref:hypothetical protein n=1 Tax=Paenibacillus sp. FSL W8-1287 TaxID=2954653 RepID=UPI0030D214DA
MNKETQQRILEFLKTSFDTEGTIHFLAVAAVQEEVDVSTQEVTFKIRVALTFQKGSKVNPYFDGTDLYVTITEAEIRFAQEDVWADGPPLREGSPNELALDWVSELVPPFFVSPQAREAADRGASTTGDREAHLTKMANPECFDKWF